MLSRSLAATAAVLLSVAAITVPAPAAEPAAGPQLAQARAALPEAGEFIAHLAADAIAGMSDKTMSLEERTRRFRTLLTADFDVPEIARFVLGRYWRVATPDERSEYTKLFEDYIVSIYAARFQEYDGEQLKVNAAVKDDDGAFVSSSIERKAGPPVKVDWKLKSQAPNFKIVDVMVEGVSMSVTQRDDFAAAIQAHGGKVAGLIDMLKQKVQTASSK
ncbi:MAG TPA: ABC transporter substrate-binding protein [Alphaproteobacteria bacterium]|nr:ABC transporter substrate-binding protein [Alphaproteobacteria bacterium]